MKLEYNNLTPVREAGLTFAANQAQAERKAAHDAQQAGRPENERETFTPETPEQYWQRMNDGMLDSYATQAAAEQKAVIDQLRPEDVQLLGAIHSADAEAQADIRAFAAQRLAQ